MDERKLKKQLFRIMALTVVGSLLLSALALGIYGYICPSPSRSWWMKSWIRWNGSPL